MTTPPTTPQSAPPDEPLTQHHAVPTDDLRVMRPISEDARAAAEALTDDDLDIVATGSGPTQRLWRWINGALNAIASPFEKLVESLRRYLVRWPVLAAFYARYRRVMDEAHRQRASLAASGAAFWLIIAIFPAMIAAVNVFGLFMEPAEVARALQGMSDSFSGTFGADMAEHLQGVAAASNRSLSVGLLVSVVLWLWSVSAGAAAMTRAIRQSYGLRALTFVEIRRRGMLAAVCVLVILGIGIGFAALEATIVEWADRLWVGYASAVVDIVAVLAFVVGLVLGLYRLAIGKRIRWKPLAPGVVFATVGLILLTIGYSSFLSVLSERYADVYGAVTGTVLTLLLAYFAVYVVLIGAIINAQNLADMRERNVRSAVPQPRRSSQDGPRLSQH